MNLFARGISGSAHGSEYIREQSWHCLSCSKSKSASLVHLAVPISAYGQHHVPGYLERLQSRSLQLGKARAEVLRNIEAVDAWIAEVTTEIQQVINTMWKYGQQQIDHLLQLKAELTEEVSEALDEVERTLHDDFPILTHPLAALMMEYSAESTSLKLFDYRIDTSAVVDGIQSMCTFKRSSPNVASVDDHIIAGVYGAKLQVYDFVEDTCEELTLAKEFTGGISTCILPTGVLLCIGGKPASTEASIIHLKSAQIQQSQSMVLPRAYPGVICVGYFAYAFGSLKSDPSCERFDVKHREWTRLPDMHHGRDAFSPSHYAGDIYLATTKDPIEVYNIAANAFTVLSVRWTGREIDCSSLFIEGELFIFTGLDEIGRWKPGDEAVAIVKCQNNGIAGFSQCQPAAYKRNVFFIYWNRHFHISSELEQVLLSIYSVSDLSFLTASQCHNKMIGQEWLCVSCSQSKASSFCFCRGKEVFLCESCWPQHYAKNTRFLHIAVPISAYGQHRIPGYFERLQSRSMHFESAKTELMKNLEALDTCIASFTDVFQKILDAVNEYGNLQLAQLRRIKAEMNTEIIEALEEVERTLHDDSPILTQPLSTIVREYKGESKVLKLFDYRLDSVSAIISEVQSLFTFTHSKSNSAVAEHIIVGISDKTLRVYDFVADTCENLTLSSAFTDGISTCILPTGALLCIGGFPASIQTSIIHLKTAQIQESQPMMRPRAYAGLICVDCFAYAFGSLKCDISCERFDVRKKEWKRLTDMSYARQSFSPAHLNGVIYLVTTRQPIEAYTIASNAFRVLEVRWTGCEIDSTSLFIEGELLIFTSYDEMGRWKPGDSAIAISECENNGIAGFSQCQPACYKRKVYFISWRTGGVNVFDLDSKVRTRKE